MTMRHGARHDAAAGDVAVEPVADRGELRRAAHDVVDRQLAGEPAVDLDRERQLPALPGPARLQPRAPGGGSVARPSPAARRHGGVPAGSARRALRRRTRAPRAGRRGSERPQRDLAVTSSGRPASRALNGRSRRSARRRAPAGLDTASPSFTPPREPGEVDHEARPDDPGQPARQGGGRHALARRRTPGSPRRCPGTSRSSSGRVTSGVRSVGVRPVPPVVSTTRAPPSTAAAIAAPTGSPSGTTTGSPTGEAEPGQEARRSAGRWCRRTPRPRRGWRPRPRPRALTRSSRAQSPRLAAGLRLDPDVGDHRAPCRRP